jgi:hypothetical protein
MAMVWLTFGLSLITMPSTIANLVGFASLIVLAYVSYKTKCLTNIKNKKDEKDN